MVYWLVVVVVFFSVVAGAGGFTTVVWFSAGGFTIVVCFSVTVSPGGAVFTRVSQAPKRAALLKRRNRCFIDGFLVCVPSLPGFSRSRSLSKQRLGLETKQRSSGLGAGGIKNAFTD